MSLWTRPRTNICYLNRLIKLRCSCHYRTGSSIISRLRAGRTTTIAMATRLPGRGSGHTSVSAPQRGSLQPRQDPEISSSSSPWAAPVCTPAPTSYCPATCPVLHQTSLINSPFPPSQLTPQPAISSLETAPPEFFSDVHFADEHTLVPFLSLSAPFTQVRGRHFVHVSRPLASGSPSASPTHSSVSSTHLCPLLKAVLPEVASRPAALFSPLAFRGHHLTASAVTPKPMTTVFHQPRALP